MTTRTFVRLCLVIYGLLGAASLLGASLELQAYAASPNAPTHAHVNNDAFEVSQIQIPGAPTQGWCYDVGWVAGNHYYLSDNSQSQIDVLTFQKDGRTTSIQPIGHNDFMGPMGCHAGNYSQEGPEGVEASHDELWTSDGNSHVLVFNIHTGQLLHRINTRGKFRADEMSINTNLGIVAITNPDETFSKPHPGIPYLSFISMRTYQVIATMPFPYAQPGQSGLQAPLWIGGNELLVDVPAPRGNNGGELDRIALDSDSYGHYQAQILQRYPLTNCSPSGLAVDTTTGIAAVGCAANQQIIWNMHTNQVLATIAVPGVDIIAMSGHHFFFPSYIKQALIITDERGNIVQVIKTSPQSHTVTADPATGLVFVPLEGGNLMILRPQHPSTSIPLPQPTGTVELNWDTNTLTATIHMTGLAASSSSSIRAYQGTCQRKGAPLFPLNPIQADTLGNGISKTTLKGIPYGIPPGDWNITISSELQPISAIQAPPTTCIAIHNRSRAGHILRYNFDPTRANN